VGGHVLTPVLEAARDVGVEIPNNFNVRSRCTPSWERIQEEIMQGFAEGEEKCRTAWEKKDEENRMKQDKGTNLGEGLEWWKIAKAHERRRGDAKGGVQEEEVKMLKKKWQGFIIAPIDKYSGDMALI
jgi:hypothetical protein